MKKSELKNFIREEIVSTLSENLDDEIKALDAYDAKLDDVIKKKEEAGIEEKVAKSVDDVIDPADYGLIGSGYLKGFNRPHSLDADQLETLGRKIVKQLYKGDFDKAKAKFIKEDEVKEPSDAEIKKNKSLAKAAEELAVLTREMKSLAKKYSKAEGQEKEDLLNKLKSKTKLKKELDKILDK
tara:strand:- start:3577 stop:4125 length:549 start_codon:yes stop_codon:yes gene_type:complete